MEETKQPKKNFVEHLDSAIGVISPAWEFKRRMARVANNQAREYFSANGGYKGATRDRLKRSWLPGGGSADEDLLPDLADLRERSRDLVRNNDIATGIMGTMTSNIVGTGILPQSNIDMESLGIEEDVAEKTQKVQERIWQKWAKHADSGNRMNFWEIQNLIEQQMLINGEVIVIPEMVDEPGRPYFHALDVIESDRLDTPSDFLSNKKIRKGVELGKRGEPVAYWIRKGHPGDMTYAKNGRSNNSENYIRYPAKNKYGRTNVYHLYWVKRPGQTRGVPFFAPVLDRFKHLDGYMESEMVAARVAACFALFIKVGDPMGSAIGRSTETEGAKRLEGLEPGLLKYLRPGEEVQSFNPARNGAQIDSFIEKVLRFIGAGLNLPYELVLKDFSKSNFSAARAAILEARRMFRQEQIWLGEKFCQPVWEMLMDEAFLRGEFDATDYFEKRDDWTRARWIGSGWAYIEPEKEINASKAAIDNHLSSLADEVAARGKDYEEILKQQSKEQKKMKELELEVPKLDNKQPTDDGSDKPNPDEEPINPKKPQGPDDPQDPQNAAALTAAAV